MKAHIGADVTQVYRLLLGEENVECADAVYAGVEKRIEHADCGGHLIDRDTTKYLQAPEQAQCSVQGPAADRKGQSAGAGQGQTSVPSDQTPVRLHQSALPGPGEEHRAAGNPVRPIEPVAGASTFAD